MIFQVICTERPFKIIASVIIMPSHRPHVTPIKHMHPHGPKRAIDKDTPRR